MAAPAARLRDLLFREITSMRHAVPGEAPSRKFPIVAILIFETAALIVRSFWQVELRESGYETNLAEDISYLIVPPILAILFIPLLRVHGKWLLHKFALAGLTWRVVFIGAALGITLRLGFWGGLIAGGSFGLLTNDSPNAVVGPTLSWDCPPRAQILLAIAMSVVTIPVIEEVINRGFLLEGLKSRGRLVAIVGSSALFAVFHNPQAILLAFCVGIFLATATLNSGTLWISTIGHASCNLVAFLDWRCMRGQWNPTDVTPVSMGIGAMATGLLIVCLALAALLVSRQIIGARMLPR
ncbi:MAG: lysostaphin resistance A-like protein [Woeseiaceae bacterium]